MRRNATRALAAVAVSIGLLAGASSAYGAPQWSEGLIKRSTVTNCPSIIFGSPYQEDGAWTWAGQWIDPADPPNTNSIFYVHVVVGGVGNPCSGQFAHFEFIPPSGVTTAINQATSPVICWAINWNTNPPSAVREFQWPAGACPSGPQGGGFGYGGVYDAQTSATGAEPWPVPQGRGWEIQIPVQSNRILNGGFDACADCAQFLSYLIDGNSSPFLFPGQGLFTDSAGAGGGAPGGAGGSGVGLTPAAQRPAPPKPAAPAATTPKKCKKGQKLRKGKCVKKKKKKK